MFCPKCGCEYQDGIKKCIDCNTELKKWKPKSINKKEKSADSFIRAIATLLDLIIVCCIIISLYFLSKYIMKFEFEDTITPQMVFLLLLCLWLYNAFFESSKYKGTIGKIVFRICVVDENFYRISFLKATIRFILKVVLGLFIVKRIFNDNDNNFLYDSISDTKVAYKKYCS